MTWSNRVRTECCAAFGEFIKIWTVVRFRKLTKIQEDITEDNL